PIFNWLLWGYGIPAAAFWFAGYLLRRRADDVPARVADALAIMFTVLLGVFEIRHYMNDGDLYRRTTGLAEVALDVSGGLALTIGLEKIRQRTGNIVHDAGAQLVALLTLGTIVAGLLLTQNPVLTGEPVGGAFFNLILLGYGLPSILSIVLALIV